MSETRVHHREATSHPRSNHIAIAVALTLFGCGASARVDTARTATERSTREDVATARAMELIARSCSPCHRRERSLDPEAAEHGVYLETAAEILRLALEPSVGHTQLSLVSLFTARAEGRELLVGHRVDRPMPPPQSQQPALTEDEARQIVIWLRTAEPCR